MGATGEPTGRASEEVLRAECEKRGLPVSLTALLRHVNNNHAAIVGFKDHSIETLEKQLEAERGLRAEAERESRVAELAEEMVHAAELRERLKAAEQRAAEASRRLEEAEAALEQIRARSRHSIGRGLSQCFEIADTFLARESSEGVSSGPDGTDESERNEHG